MWHHMTWQSEPAQVNPSENPKFTFSNLVTLTFNLGTWPSNSSEISSRSTSPPNFAYVTVHLWDRWQISGRTHRRDQFYTSTADMGGNNIDSQKLEGWYLVGVPKACHWLNYYGGNRRLLLSMQKDVYYPLQGMISWDLWTWGPGVKIMSKGSMDTWVYFVYIKKDNKSRKVGLIFHTCSE